MRHIGKPLVTEALETNDYCEEKRVSFFNAALGAAASIII